MIVSDEYPESVGGLYFGDTESQEGRNGQQAQ